MADVEALTVLHLLAPAPVGGLERVVQGLARGQAAAGHRVATAVVVESPAEAEGFVAPLRQTPVPIHVLEVPHRAYLRERGLVRALCQEARPDVVHTHGYRPDVVDSGVARGLGLPTVTTVHGFTGNALRNRIYEWLQMRAFRRFDAVVAVARSQVEVLTARGVPGKRIRVIRNAMDVRQPESAASARARWGVDADVFHVGWVGRLSPEKGPDVMVDALATLASEEVLTSFVGSGPLQEPLRARAESHGVADRIRWQGLVPDAARLFPGFDVLVLSSRTEGTPMVLLEAMVAGVPVVATRVGGVPDVVGPAEALLVAPEDPEALGAAIDAVRRDRRGARERAEAARRRVAEAFGFEAWIRRYDEVYRTVLDTRSGCRGPEEPTVTTDTDSRAPSVEPGDGGHS